ncbi:ribonuclease P/MRP protein subunit [Coprinopsis sp. MPI-PUGE-AT-0042]|nr:ribonuclease P/MRP protein subunit [Coprinopsis sp. MPI-PUGE-AT-0042]
MSGNGNKRKKDGGQDEMTGREKKKVRLAEARSIPVQTPGPSTPSMAGPSKVVPTTNSLAGLPSAIDVEKFSESRAFEIGAMQTAMKTASAGSTQRAWQALPRHLRRRAASHDVRRVPVRLRERARGEMDAKPVKGKSGPKRGKLKAITRTDSFLKRQKNKIWLETHLWHAKRMHMENMWGYRLATHPTEKSYRPSHRASVQGSIIHDASYFSLVELRGPEKDLVSLLELCCDPQAFSPGSIARKRGGRALEIHFYSPGAYPYDLIAPISIMWQPAPETQTPSKGEGVKPTQSVPGPSASNQIGPNGSSSDPRTIWLRFHPCVHEEMMTALKAAASQHLAACQEVPEVQIQVVEMKDQINVFEIMGPKSSQVLKGALSPVASEDRQDFLKWWSSLGDVQTPGSVPENMVIGFKVLDPRLKFPPKNAKARMMKAIEQSPATGNIYPSVRMARSEIWDENVRLGLAKPKYQKKDLDERRSNNAIPGTKLQPLRQDDRVPVLLIQRSLESHGEDSTRSEALHGWTLIVPSGWGMAFWNSLTFTGTRVGGQRERQVQAYESSTAYFPRDYPFTSAYDAFSARREEELRKDWERKPPAKRVNYEKLKVDHPWTPEWHRVLRIPLPVPSGEEDLVSAEREGTVALEPTIKPWLLRGAAELEKIMKSVSSCFLQGQTLLDEINNLRSGRSLPLLPNTLKGNVLLAGALVLVRVNMTSRGTPEDMALLYGMDDAEIVEELKKGKRKHNEVETGDDEEEEEPRDVPPADKIIGRVTTGHYSLSRGCGFAIAAIPFTRMIQLKDQMSK